MINDLMYIELKSGYSDNGPAWIGRVKVSKTGKTIYFNNRGFQKNIGYCSNYIDIETGEEYWISGLKKNQYNRHWAGYGKIIIDKKVVDEYLQYIGEEKLDLTHYVIADIKDEFPVERIHRFLNDRNIG